MRKIMGLACLLVLMAGGAVAQDGMTLRQARQGHVTQLSSRTAERTAVPRPPKGVLQVVSYPAPPGALAAYLTPPPTDKARHPAIIWITGGDISTIGDFWSPAPAADDQSARAFREAGIVTMYPSLRGGNRNPGYHEGFYGELDDILAAADYLAALPYVDPSRIYLAGHSTGGTAVLLTAEYDPRFRAVFAFGPVEEVADYGGQFAPIDLKNPLETKLRSPVRWLASVRSPVFVFEGDHQANTDSLRALEKASTNPLIRFFVIRGADHFSTLAPTTRVIARKILADTGERSNIDFTAADLP